MPWINETRFSWSSTSWVPLTIQTTYLEPLENHPNLLLSQLEKNLSGHHNKWIWKSSTLYFFMWQLFLDAILTRDSMKKRKWLCSPICSFCGDNESAQHIFLSCSIAKVAWWCFGQSFGG
jgi:hypothetical protein